MKNEANISGHIARGEYMIGKYYMPCAYIIALLMPCIIIALLNEKHYDLPVLLVMMVYYLLVGWLMTYSYFHNKIFNTTFQIGAEKIVNIGAQDDTIELALKEDLFITSTTIEFTAYKSSIYRPFYLFSSNPFQYDDVQGGGANSLARLNKRRIVMIPKNEETELWVAEEFKNIRIPEFPSAVYFPKRTGGQGEGLRRTGDGSLS